MSENKKSSFNEKHLPLIVVGLILSCLIVLYVIDSTTILESIVPAPCQVIQNPQYEIPDNVITKGYTINRDENGTAVSNTCYYIKDAGIVSRTFYGWSIYD